jgi:hypothetical protein
MHNITTLNKTAMLFAGLLASSIAISTAQSLAAQGNDQPWQAPAAANSPLPSLTLKTPPSVPAAAKSAKASMLYQRLWGIDNIQVRETSSGALLLFSWRVVDANKAKVLNDKKATPYLIDERTGAALQVPTMEKVGQLRQTATPQNGRKYWMVFSNKGTFVRPGSHVDIVIGGFHVNGLVVQ